MISAMTAEEKVFRASLREGEAIETTVIGNDLVAIKLTFAELAPRMARPGILGLFSNLMRPGVGYLQRYLELHYFKPYTPAMKLFECFVLKWAYMEWCLALFPRTSIEWGALEYAIGRAGLVAKPVTPMALISDAPPLRDGSKPSPVKEAFERGYIEPDLPWHNVLYLENVPGHVVYRDPRRAMAEEVERMDALEREWEASR